MGIISISKTYNVSRRWAWTPSVSPLPGPGFFHLVVKVVRSVKRAFNSCVSSFFEFFVLLLVNSTLDSMIILSTSCWKTASSLWSRYSTGILCSAIFSKPYSHSPPRRDTPLNLMAQYGAFLNSSIIEDFNNYASIVFERYGRKVKTWITFNEPQVGHSWLLLTLISEIFLFVDLLLWLCCE